MVPIAKPLFDGTLTPHFQTDCSSKYSLQDRTRLSLGIDLSERVSKYSQVVSISVEKKENALIILSAMEIQY